MKDWKEMKHLAQKQARRKNQSKSKHELEKYNKVIAEVNETE